MILIMTRHQTLKSNHYGMDPTPTHRCLDYLVLKRFEPNDSSVCQCNGYFLQLMSILPANYHLCVDCADVKYENCRDITYTETIDYMSTCQHIDNQVLQKLCFMQPFTSRFYTQFIGYETNHTLWLQIAFPIGRECKARNAWLGARVVRAACVMKGNLDRQRV